MIQRRKSIKRTALKRSQTRIRPVSTKQRARLVLYGFARVRVILKDGGCVACLNSNLAIPCDGQGKIEVDHVDGRIGALLLDESNMVSFHRAAHQYKTDHARACRPGLREYARQREATWAASR